MSVKKIVFIDHEPLTQRVYDIFQIKQLIEAGYFLEYRDISKFLYPGIEMHNKFENNQSVQIKNINEYIESFSKDIKTETLYIAVFPNNWKNRKLYRILKLKTSKVVQLEMYSTFILKLNFRQRVFLFASTYKTSIKNKILSWAYLLYKRIYNFNPIDIKITSQIKYVNENHVVAINHPDYELALKLKEMDKIMNQPFIVFLDEYFPFHPDYVTVNNIKPSNKDFENYQKKLCDFFDRVEKKHELKIIIALHPRANYKLGVFGGRELVKHRTCELVRDAKFTILHSSASIHFSIIYKKPILFLSTNEFIKYPLLVERIRQLSKYFKAPHINLDQENFQLPDPSINSLGYNGYTYTYLTNKDIERKYNVDIILDFLKNYNLSKFH